MTFVPPAANAQAVAISAIGNDVATGNHNVMAGEFFIDTTTAANGTGTAMTAALPSPTATIAGTIPAATIAGLSTGLHTFYVHARDAAGNWGPRVSASFRIDRTAPTFSSITLSPSSIASGTATTGLTVNGASDGASGSGVGGGEFWIANSNVPAGGGTAFNGLTASVPTGSLVPGTYTVRVRIRDLAGNWSTGNNGVRTATLDRDRTRPGRDLQRRVRARDPAGHLDERIDHEHDQAERDRRRGAGRHPRAPGPGQQHQLRPVQLRDGREPRHGHLRRPVLVPAERQDHQWTGHLLGSHEQRQLRQPGLPGPLPDQQRAHRRSRSRSGPANANTTWTTINGGTAVNTIEVVWQAVGSGGPNPGSLRLYVNGVLSQTLTTASTSSVGAVRLGAVTSGGGSSTAEYFDALRLEANRDAVRAVAMTTDVSPSEAKRDPDSRPGAGQHPAPAAPMGGCPDRRRHPAAARLGRPCPRWDTSVADPSSARVVSATALEADYGVRFDLVAVTASGGLVDLRFTVLDQAKAKLLFHDAASSPALFVEGSGRVLRTRKGMSHHLSLLSGGRYFVLFSNSGGAVQAGTPVSVVIDDVRLESIAAQS